MEGTQYKKLRKLSWWQRAVRPGDQSSNRSLTILKSAVIGEIPFNSVTRLSGKDCHFVSLWCSWTSSFGGCNSWTNFSGYLKNGHGQELPLLANWSASQATQQLLLRWTEESQNASDQTYTLLFNSILSKFRN